MNDAGDHDERMRELTEELGWVRAQVAQTQQVLDEITATRWWRLRTRLLRFPVLGRLARRITARRRASRVRDGS